jgi:hypothetical protein
MIEVRFASYAIDWRARSAVRATASARSCRAAQDDRCIHDAAPNRARESRAAIGVLFEHCTGARGGQLIPQSNGARDVGHLADDKCARHYGQVSLTIIDRPR